MHLKPIEVLFFILPSGKIYGGGNECDSHNLLDKTMLEIYDQEKDADGFLYLCYGGEKYTG